MAGASAEFFGDIALSPFEAVKVRIQTSPPGTFPTTLRVAAPKVSFCFLRLVTLYQIYDYDLKFTKIETMNVTSFDSIPNWNSSEYISRNCY